MLQWNYTVFQIVIVGFISACSGNLNLYVDGDQVKKLLGVSNQLWYVREGKVNHYALSYDIVVPSYVDTLIFHWEDRSQITILYNIDIHVGNKEAVPNAWLNISDHGLVPHTPTAWSLSIKCSGRVQAQVDIVLTLNVTITSSLADITTFNIKRRKICLLSADDAGSHPQVEEIDFQNSTTIFYLTVGGLAVFLIIVITIVCYSYVKSKKTRGNSRSSMLSAINTRSSAYSNSQGQPTQRSRDKDSGNMINRTGLSTDPWCTPTRTSNSSLEMSVQARRQQVALSKQDIPNNCRSKTSQSSLSDQRRSPQPTNTTTATTTTTTAGSPEPQYSDPRQGDVAAKLVGHYVAEDSVRLLDLLMEGTFGRVYHALHTQSGEQEEPRDVLVKTVTDASSELQRSVMLQEGLMLAGLEHDHLLPLVGCITPSNGPPRLLYPHPAHGNLKKFLQSCHTLLTQEVVSLGLQVLKALHFLHMRLLLHKDVATRNCVVDDRLHVFLTDCALSRDLFPNDYHCLGDNENRPVKWLSLEALQHKMFSPASDVWSWGVLLWEVMTLGQQPYVEIDPFEMAPLLKQGVRLAQPINCPDELFKAMTFCWTAAARERPSVEELSIYLTNFQHHLNQYV